MDAWRQLALPPGPWRTYWPASTFVKRPAALILTVLTDGSQVKVRDMTKLFAGGKDSAKVADFETVLGRRIRSSSLSNDGDR
jgi:hypothetical protein